MFGYIILERGKDEKGSGDGERLQALDEDDPWRDDEGDHDDDDGEMSSFLISL